MVSAVLISFCQSLCVIRNSLHSSFLCPKQCKSVYFTVLVFASFLFLYSDFPLSQLVIFALFLFKFHLFQVPNTSVTINLGVWSVIKGHETITLIAVTNGYSYGLIYNQYNSKHGPKCPAFI